MRALLCLIVVLTCAVSSLRADFWSPFADSRVGATVTSQGQIVAIQRKGGGTNYFVRCATCTGPENIPAEIPAALLSGKVIGRPANITVTVRERDDGKTKLHYLEVSRIEVSK